MASPNHSLVFQIQEQAQRTRREAELQPWPSPWQEGLDLVHSYIFKAFIWANITFSKDKNKGDRQRARGRGAAMGVPLLPAAARRLEGKVALITGAARGIGECTAKLFFKHGAKVVIADIEDDLGHSLSNHLSSSSSSFVHCDVTKEKDVENAVDKAISKYGKLDIMFNNAGISGALNFNILEDEPSDFEKVFHVNLLGAFLGTKHAARAMIPARRGSIIMNASVCSTTGGIAPHAYTSSKHGMLGLMRNVAVELGQYGIRVNCVSPHVVPTQMTRDLFKLEDSDEFPNVYSHLKVGDILSGEDVAEAALYLGSDASKYVSGHNLIVDGGFSVVNQGLCSYEQSDN